MRYWKSREIVGSPRVGIGVATYLSSASDRRAAALRCLVESFRAQTWQDWRLYIVHDGPVPDGQEMQDYLAALRQDPRVSFVATDERKQKFGHPWRQKALNHLCATSAWVMLTNDDNYYAPVFLEWLLSVGTRKKPACDLVYCDMVHSHRSWKYMPVQPRYRHMDLGGFIVRASIAKQVAFDKFEFNGDGDWITRLMQKCGNRAQKVPAVLFMHN